jgi:hypothetical protein
VAILNPTQAQRKPATLMTPTGKRYAAEFIAENGGGPGVRLRKTKGKPK